MQLPANLQNQTITHYPRSGYTVDGRENFSAGTAYKARVQEVTKSRFLPNGQVVTVDAVVYISGEPSMSINDKIVYNSVSYKIHARAVAVDGQGNANHTKLELVKWQL